MGFGGKNVLGSRKHQPHGTAYARSLGSVGGLLRFVKRKQDRGQPCARCATFISSREWANVLLISVFAGGVVSHQVFCFYLKNRISSSLPATQQTVLPGYAASPSSDLGVTHRVVTQ